MLVAMLNNEKKLNHNDPIEKYLSGLPYPNITIRNLLNHTSGLPDYQKLMDEQWDKTKVAGNDDILFYLKKFHPASLFKPGEKYQYSNTGYVLLGTIVEKAAGEEFIAYCKKRIFQPLAMTSTDIRSKFQREVTDNFARGYIYVPEKRRYVLADSFPSSNYTIWLGGRKGPGRVSSTTSDLLKWDQALYTEKFASRKTLDEIFSPAKLSNDSLSNYGFGWMLRNDSILGKIVFHTGDNPGYKTEIIRYIDKNKTLIVLCNNAHEKFDELVKAAEQIIKKD
jgi:CubicO group peptidase (beta-lactamase class C family)